MLRFRSGLALVAGFVVAGGSIAGSSAIAQSPSGAAAPARAATAQEISEAISAQMAKGKAQQAREIAARQAPAKRSSRAEIEESHAKWAGRQGPRTVARLAGRGAPGLTAPFVTVPKGEEIKAALGPSALMLQNKDGKPGGALYSSVPIAIPADREALKAAVAGKGVVSKTPLWEIADLGWRTQEPGGFRVKKALGEISAPGTAGGTLQVGPMAFRVGPAGSAAPAAVTDEAPESVVYPSMDAKTADGAGTTDLVVRSLTNGVRFGLVIRDPGAPRTQRLEVTDLPEGWILRASQRVQGEVDILDPESELAGTISPAVASDADGQVVPVSVSVEGRTVTYRIEKDLSTVPMPVTIDPTVTFNPVQWIYNYAEKLTYDVAGWYGVRSRDIPQLSTHQQLGSGTDNGLYAASQAAPYGTLVQNDFAAWVKFAPGDQRVGTPSAIPGHTVSSEHAFWFAYEVLFDYFMVPPDAGTYKGDPGVSVGLWSNGLREQQASQFSDEVSGSSFVNQQPRGWAADRNQTSMPGKYVRGWIGTTAGPDQWSAAQQPGNAFDWGIVDGGANGTGPRPHTVARLSGVKLYAYDNVAPEFVAPVTSQPWKDRRQSISVTARDRGLGVYSVALIDGALNAIRSKTFMQCPGTGDEMCPFDAPVTLGLADVPEGESQYLNYEVVDAGARTTYLPVTVRIDGTPPIAQRDPSQVVNGQPATVSPVSPDPALRTIKIKTADLHSGVKSVAVKVDGQPVAVAQPTCTGTNCQGTFPVEVPTTTMTTGTHQVEVTVTDQIVGSGNATIDGDHITVQTLEVQVVGDPAREPRTPELALGFEDWMTYDSTPTGAGSTHRVNLATGNSLWSSTLVSNPGIGLDTVMRVTYNSLEPSGLLTSLLSDGGRFGYGTVGRGFSAQLGSITRVNEPLWFAGAAGLPPLAQDGSDVQKIVLTDGDGTRHTFTRVADTDEDVVRFTPPAGVELELRRFSTDDETRRWAATRPDGTTFYFGQNGLPTWTEDRHHNKLRLDYEDVPGTLIPSCGYALECTKRLWRIVDAAGLDQTDLWNTVSADENDRAWTISYVGNKISEVRDRKRIGSGENRPRRVTKFEYDSADRLEKVTVANNAPVATQQRRFEFSYGAGLTSGTTSAYLTGVKDPVGNTTHVRYGAAQPVTGILDPLLGALGLIDERRKVTSVRDRASTGETSRTTSYTYDAPVVSANETDVAKKTSRVTNVQNARGASDAVKTDGLGRMTELIQVNDSNEASDPAPRKTAQGWTADNYVAFSTVGLGEADKAVTTEYTWGALGQLKSENQHAGGVGANPGAPNQRDRTWTYREHCGTNRNAEETAADCSTDPNSGDGIVDPFVYDVETSQSWSGATTTYSYGATPELGDLTTIAEPANGFQELSYNSRGLVTGHAQNAWLGLTQPTFVTGAEDARPAEYWALFDGNGDPIQHANQRVKFDYTTYDEVGNVLSFGDTRALVPLPYDGPEAPAAHEPDPVDFVKGVHAAAGASPSSSAYTARMTYDALDRETTRAIPKRSEVAVADRFIVTAKEYDKNDNEVRSLDGEGHITDRAFTATDEIQRETAPASAHHDDSSSDNDPAESGATGEVTRYQYDEADNLVERSDPLGTLGSGGHRTRWTYNLFDEPTAQVRVAGDAGTSSKVLATSRAYDTRGNVIAETDAKTNGDITGIPAGEQPSNAAIDEFGKTAAGNALDESRKRQKYSYDVFDRLVDETENPVGGTDEGRDVALNTHYEYDENDNLKLKRTPAGRTSTYSYDAADRIIEKREPFAYNQATKTTDPDKMAVTTIRRRADGLPAEITAPRGNDGGGLDGFVTRLSYYPTGELRSREMPRANGQYGEQWHVAYDIDDIGDPVSITDGRGKTFSNEFLNTGQLRTTTRPSFWIYDQNEQGVRERSDEDPAPGSNQRTELPEPGTGDFGDVKPQQLPDVLPAAGKTSLGYDGELRLTSARSRTDAPDTQDPDDEEPTYQQTLTYDAVGRLKTRTIPLQGSDTIQLRWQYDPVGNVRAEFDGENQATVYDYDQFDRLTSTSTPRSCTAGSTDPSDPDCERPQTTQDYDQNGNVTDQHLPAKLDPANLQGQGTTGTRHTDYDAVDRPIATTDPSGSTTSQQYDPDGLVIKDYAPLAAQQPASSEKERYATTYIRDGAGRITQQTKKATDTPTVGIPKSQNLVWDFEYDRNGNTTKVESPGSLKTTGDDNAPPQRVQRRAYDGRDLPYSTTVGSGADERTTFTEYDGNGWLRRTVMPAGTEEDDDGNVVPTNSDTQNDTSPGNVSTRNAETLERTDDGLLKARNLPWDSSDGPTGENGSTRYRQRFTYSPRGILTRVTGVYKDGDGVHDADSGDGDDENGGTPDHATDVELNAAGWPTKTTSKDLDDAATAVTMDFTYDKQGNQATWASPGNGRRVQNRYFPSGQVRSRCGVRLDGTGSNVSEEQIYSFRYDRSGRLSRMIDWAHHRVPSGVPADDRCDEAESDTNPAPGTLSDDPRPTEITRDRAGRPLRVDEQFGADKDTAYRYEPGSPTQVAEIKTDGAFTSPGSSAYDDGKRTEYRYDEQDRNTKVSVWNDSEDTDPADRVSDMRWWPSGDQRELAKPTVNTAGDRSTDRRFYDSAGLISRREARSASGTSTRTTTYDHDKNGNRTRDERGGTSADPGYEYNARNQLTQWTRSRNGATPAKTAKDPGKTVTYAPDGAGRQTTTTEEIVVNDPNYDDVTTTIVNKNSFIGDRLDRTARSIKVTAKTVPSNGSVPADEYETDCFVYNAMGSQTRSLRRTTSNDNVACQTSRQPTSDWRTQNQNTFDTFERLVASRQRGATTRPSPGQSGSSQPGQLGDNEAYCYDGMDRRDRRLTNLDSTSNPAETDGDLTAFQKARAACSQNTTGTGIQVYDLSYRGLTEKLSRENRPNGGVQTYEYTATDQRLGRLKQTGSGTTTATQWRAYDTDAQGSVMGLENPTTGEVSDDSRYDTDPYGSPVAPETGTTDDAADRRENPFRFQGFYKDDATGNYDMQARTYRSEIGQFLQQDRFADPQADLRLATDPLTSSRYAFTAGNPSTYGEYDGHHTGDTVSGAAVAEKANKDAIANGDNSPARRAASRRFDANIAVQDAYYQVTRRPLKGQGSSPAPPPPLKAAQAASGGSSGSPLGAAGNLANKLLDEPIIKANVYGEGPSARDLLGGVGAEVSRIQRTYLSPQSCAALIEQNCEYGFRTGDPNASSTSEKLLDLSAVATFGATRGASVLGAVNTASNRIETARLAAKIPRMSRAYTAAQHRDLYHLAPTHVSTRQLMRGRTFPIPSGDGVPRRLLQTRGAVNDVEGVFEYIVGPEGVTHQQFIRGGRVTGNRGGK